MWQLKGNNNSTCKDVLSLLYPDNNKYKEILSFLYPDKNV